MSENVSHELDATKISTFGLESVWHTGGKHPKIEGKSSNHPFVHRVFHYFHHPFWVFSPYFWIDTHIHTNCDQTELRPPSTTLHQKSTKPIAIVLPCPKHSWANIEVTRDARGVGIVNFNIGIPINNIPKNLTNNTMCCHVLQCIVVYFTDTLFVCIVYHHLFLAYPSKHKN